MGDELTMQVGGDFSYAPPSPRNLLLIAGGVGINPFISMLQHHTNLLHHHRHIDLNTSQDGGHGGSVQILFSAKSPDELIFKVYTHIICIVSANMYVLLYQ